MATVDVLVPVYNEEGDIPRNIPVLCDFLAGPQFSHDWRVTIGDNGSTDGTRDVSLRLTEEYPDRVFYFSASGRGKGRVIKEAWLASDAEIVSFMDVDLSTGLAAFPALIAAITDQGYDLAIASRLAAQSQVRRSPVRRVLTRGYNTIVKTMFSTNFNDAQCGFKASSRDAAHRLLPLVKDVAWFFDTELLILAERLGYRVKEVPVTWTEDERTSVRLLSTVAQDLRGLLRMRLTQPWRRARAPGQDAAKDAIERDRMVD